MLQVWAVHLLTLMLFPIFGIFYNRYLPWVCYYFHSFFFLGGLFSLEQLLSSIRIALDWIFLPPPKCMCWNRTLSVMVFVGGAFGRCLSWGWSPREWDSCLYERGDQPAPEPLPLCENTGRKQPSRNKEAGPPQTLNGLESWPWTFQPPEQWETPFCCLRSSQSIVFCYSSPNGLRQGTGGKGIWALLFISCANMDSLPYTSESQFSHAKLG